MGTINPTWVDNVSVQAPYAISYGVCLDVTNNPDLRGEHGAYLFIGVGRSGTTGLTNGVDVRVRRLLNNGTGAPKYGADLVAFRTGTVCGERAVNNGDGYAAGSSSFAFDGTGGTSFAVGDLLCFWGVDAVPGSDGAVSPANGSEFLRVSKGITTPVVTDQGCGVAKINNEVFCQADAWIVWLPGGSLYELIFDYGDDSAGGRILCEAHLQMYTEDTTA